MKTQSLELCDRFFPDVDSGKKSHTLRYNEGKITEGYLEFYASDTPELKRLVYVTEVISGPLSEFAVKYKDTTPDSLLESMKGHGYDDIQLDSTVSLIKHLTPSETQAKLQRAQKAGNDISINRGPT